MNPPLGDRELDIMQELWGRPGATVTEVHEGLTAKGHNVAYTTVQTLLNRLHKKKLADRNTDDRAHRFYAAVPREALMKKAVDRLAHRFFAGSAAGLAVRLVETDLTTEELKRLRQLIDSSIEERR